MTKGKTLRHKMANALGYQKDVATFPNVMLSGTAGTSVRQK